MDWEQEKLKGEAMNWKNRQIVGFSIHSPEVDMRRHSDEVLLTYLKKFGDDLG